MLELGAWPLKPWDKVGVQMIPEVAEDGQVGARHAEELVHGRRPLRDHHLMQLEDATSSALRSLSALVHH
jgi:hypothetical protein